MFTPWLDALHYLRRETGASITTQMEGDARSRND